MTATDSAPTPERASEASRGVPPDVIRDAFRELHGRSLHGFALLLTVGDRGEAAEIASEALAAGAARVEELRHPERAAAWLRRRVVQRAHVGRKPRADSAALDELGADGDVAAAMGGLDRLERAALIAFAVERLDRRDVATIVGRDGDRLDRLLRRSRERYMRAHAASAGDAVTDGPIVSRVREVARRAMT